VEDPEPAAGVLRLGGITPLEPFASQLFEAVLLEIAQNLISV
jgi:hypothetical protein